MKAEPRYPSRAQRVRRSLKQLVVCARRAEKLMQAGLFLPGPRLLQPQMIRVTSEHPITRKNAK